jgi:glycosyltransferase involved in cell wall biosynthesis
MVGKHEIVKRRLLFIVNVDWFFVSHRLPIALAALSAGYDVHIGTRFTGHEDRLRDFGFHLHPLPLARGGNNPAMLFRESWTIYRLMRSVRADVVHLVTIKPVLVGGIAARLTNVGGVLAAVSGLGTVFLAEGYGARIRRAVVKALYRLALHHRNLRLVVQNTDDMQMLQAMTKLSSDVISLIPGSGVDTDLFNPTGSPENDPPVVMLAGRLLKDKGVREFAEAARLLRADPKLKHEQARYVLVGSPDPENASSIDKLTLEKWQESGVLELWGSRDDMAAVMQSADIVVLPSYREGMPKVLLEAAASGKPVVTSDVPGCRDAIVSGRTGLLVKVRDSVSLANGIKLLLIDKELRIKMGKEGRQLALDRYRIEAVTERHLELYEELIASGADLAR